MATPVGQPIRFSPEAIIEGAVFEYTLVSADAFTFNHGFVEKPKVVEVYLKCKTAELGYAIGDEVELAASANVTVACSSQLVKYAAVTLPQIVNRTNATATTVTAANWTLVFKLQV